MRGAFALSLVLAGCSSSPQLVVGGGALLSSLSDDQQWLALLAQSQAYPNGTHTGELQVVPVGGGALQTLDTLSDGGTFERGAALWFLGGVTTVSEGTPPLPRYFGALKVWLPGMSAPVKVGTNVQAYFPSQDSSSVVFLDYATPSLGARCKLVTVSSTTCGTGTCMPITLASDILASQAAWRISDDGKWVLAAIHDPVTTNPGQVLLAAPATGDLTTLSTAVNPRSPMMTPAGDTIAWLEGANKLEVTPTAAPLPATLAPAAPIVDAAAMIDAGDFLLKVRSVDKAGNPGAASFEKLSATASSSLPVQKPGEFFVSQYVPGATNRYVFYSLAPNSAYPYTADLWMLDMTKAGAQPVQLAGAAPTPLVDAVQFSDDGGAIRWLDGYDAATRLGNLYATTLASPSPTAIGTGTLRFAGFIPTSERLLYVAGIDMTSDMATVTGVLTLEPKPGMPTIIEGVGLVNFQSSRKGPPRTYYTQKTGGGSDGIWYMAQP